MSQYDTDLDKNAANFSQLSPLTFLDSVLLLYLRGLLSEAEARGERAAVSATDIVDQLRLYERSQNTDRAGFDKRIKAAIEKAKKNNIISQIRSGEDRYRVSHSLKLMFSAEEVAALATIYKAHEKQAMELED